MLFQHSPRRDILLSTQFLLLLLLLFSPTLESHDIEVEPKVKTKTTPKAATVTSGAPAPAPAPVAAAIKSTKNVTTPTNLNIITSNNTGSTSSSITILHEIPQQHHEKPLELNTHEVLPVKPVKKKPYTLLDKAIGINFEKPARTSKEYDLHPVTFDFNLGDLEDLTHVGEKTTSELTSSEAKHLLSDDDNDDKVGMPYTVGAEHEENVSDGLDIEISLDEASTNANNTSTSTSTTTSVFTSSSSTGQLPTVVTVSPHIFKILKNKSSAKKERELLKHDDASKRFGTNVNSLNGRGGHDDENGDNSTGATAAGLLHVANLFQIVTNLYDHFYWQAADIRAKVTTGCGLEMQAYLTGLHGNYEWAQKAYDASGRYRGQILYGSDKWIGEKNSCYELNRQLQPEERKHFEFQFFVSVIELRIWVPNKLELKLQIGECLPKSCTSQDVHAILTLDPQAHILTNLGSQQNSNNSTEILVKRVRTVPGIYSYWRELKFQIFASFLVTFILLVIFATCYQAKLSRNQLTMSIPAISAKIDATARQNGEFQNNGKGFELYQMRTLGENNNVTVANTEAADVNGNRGPIGAESTKVTEDTNRNADVEKATQMVDCHLETNSSAGAGGTYEARKPLGLHEQVLLCFAFQTNSSTILSIDDKNESQTACIHGLRVLSVLWTIMVHTYLQMFNIGENRYRRVIVERSIFYQFIGNATFSVDTFFFISGFLVTLLFFRQTKKYPDIPGQFVRRSCLDTLLLFLYRYIRLTPAYLFVIFFNDFALRQTSDNSVFQPTVATTTCSQYWWRNILYINNFYPLSEICMIWSWYMANDMQFYFMATVLLVLSTRYFKTAVLIVCTFLLTSWGLTGIISLQHHYTHKVANPFESFDFLYDKPWQRVGTYIVGMFTGYLIYKVKTPPRVSERINFVLWLCSFGLLALIIFGVWQGELNEVNTAFYVSVGHTAFGVALVWIVLSCCWGLAPTWNRILSYRGLWPLSRLTYCTYLIHPVIMLITSFFMDGTVHLNNIFVLTISLGNAVVSFGVAFFISVLFESPIIRLLKICFRK